tara:strand:- start:399 stop:1097 length:699 start_codon:yes stop_codon:yes gene_type:complete
MKKFTILFIVLLIGIGVTKAQDSIKVKKHPNIQFFLEGGGSLGSSTYSGVGAMQVDRFLGKKKKIIVGTGLRFTGFHGSDVNFTTAPANLTSNDENIDTLLAPTPHIYSANLMLNLGYQITDKFQAGFSIDLVGFSFGPTGSPRYIRSGKYKTVSAKPSSPNYLLTGDHDIGSLNSQFYLKYKFSKRFGAKLAYQYLFNELRTTTTVQTSPEANNRFRNKDSSIYVGGFFNF